MNYLVSACLMGTNCRYNATGCFLPALKELETQGHQLIPVCPEVLGGLPTPRPPAERQQDGRVTTQAGDDVTKPYEEGAKMALALAQTHGCQRAILKERSPSCGCGSIYDGTFSNKLTQGNGITAQLLLDHHIPVYGESQLEELISNS